MWIYVIIAVIIFILLKELIRLPTIRNYGNRYVFITGCDTGFGNELAKRLDSLGFHVFAGCFAEMGADDLKKVSSARMKTLHLDVTKIESVEKARMEVEKHLPSNKGLWALVNNAGVTANFADTDLLKREDYDKCLAVNLFGVIDVTRVFQPLLRKGQGRIVNMSSALGRIGWGGAPLCVSKYGVEAFSDILRREVLKQGMTVHIINPGFFKTNINTIAFLKMYKERFSQASEDTQLYYGKGYVDKAIERRRTTLNKITSTETSLVVDAYTHAITAIFPRKRYLVGSDCKYYFRFLWNLPEFISDRILMLGAAEPEGAK